MFLCALIVYEHDDMENVSNIPTATFESVWAILKESAERSEKSREDFDRQLQETDLQMKKSREDFDRRLQETDLQMKKSREDFDRRLKETDLQMKQSREDFDRQLQETDLQMKKSREDFDRERKASREDFDRRLKNLDKILGSWAFNQGAFAEEYFFNSFENGQQNFFGEKFDSIEKNFKGVKDGIRDEYDIVLINGKSVGIIEVKYKAHRNDIPDVIRKADTFRKIFSDFANHQVYLGLASLAFYPELEQECIKEGIAVIKQAGESVVINDEHLKIF